MTDGEVVKLGQDALMTVLTVAGPILGLSVGIGLVVSVAQAVTQVHEHTLTFVPKVLAALVCLGVAGAWMLQRLIDYTGGLLSNMHAYVR